jgi:hypothetical protein
VQSLHRGARDVFHLRHRNEVAQVPQFHCLKRYTSNACSGKKHSLSQSRALRAMLGQLNEKKRNQKN